MSSTTAVAGRRANDVADVAVCVSLANPTRVEYNERSQKKYGRQPSVPLSDQQRLRLQALGLAGNAGK